MSSPVTSWSFDGMDWNNPISSHAVYIEALCQSLLERLFVLKFAPTDILYKPLYLHRGKVLKDYDILSAIHSQLINMIPHFVNHTNNGGNWNGKQEIPLWTKEDLFDYLNLTELLLPQEDMLRNDEWLKQSHDIVNLLLWTKETDNVVFQITNYARKANASVSCVSAAEEFWTYARCYKERENHIDNSNWSKSEVLGDLNSSTWDNSTSFWNIFGTSFKGISNSEVKQGLQQADYEESPGSALNVYAKVFKRISRARPKFFWQEGIDEIRMEQGYSKTKISYVPEIDAEGDVYIKYTENYEEPEGHPTFDPDKFHILPYIGLNMIFSGSLNSGVEFVKEDEYKVEVPSIEDPTLGPALLKYRKCSAGVSGGGASDDCLYGFSAETGNEEAKTAGNIVGAEIVLKHDFKFK